MVAPLDATAVATRLASLLQRALAPSALPPNVAASPREDLNRLRLGARRGAHPSATLAGQWATAEGLRARASAIARDHPDRARAVSRLLVGALLAQEFGAELTSDPSYQAVVDEVMATIERTPGLSADLQRVLDHLLAS